MFVNATKQVLAEGGVVVGCLLAQPEPTVAEMLALAGFDFILMDGEHGTFEPSHVAEVARAVELRGVTPLARVTANRPEIILRYLDAGAHGVQVPSLESGIDVESVVRAAKYRPRGERGLAGGRVSDFGLGGTIAEYTIEANNQTMVVGHVESREAVDRVGEFVEVDGLDVVFMGPVDLSQSLGRTGETGHPDVVEAMESVARVVLPSGKALGVFAPTPDSARDWVSRGARYILTSLDSLMLPAALAYLDVVRG